MSLKPIVGIVSVLLAAGWAWVHELTLVAAPSTRADFVNVVAENRLGIKTIQMPWGEWLFRRIITPETLDGLALPSKEPIRIRFEAIDYQSLSPAGIEEARHLFGGKITDCSFGESASPNVSQVEPGVPCLMRLEDPDQTIQELRDDFRFNGRINVSFSEIPVQVDLNRTKPLTLDNQEIWQGVEDANSRGSRLLLKGMALRGYLPLGNGSVVLRPLPSADGAYVAFFQGRIDQPLVQGNQNVRGPTDLLDCDYSGNGLAQSTAIKELPLLVTYSEDAARKLGTASHDETESMVRTAVKAAQDVFDRQEIPAKIRLRIDQSLMVGVGEDPLLNGMIGLTKSVAYERLKAARIADELVLVFSSQLGPDTCGFASSIPADQDRFFAVVNANETCINQNSSLLHELGHLLGARHDLETSGGNFSVPSHAFKAHVLASEKPSSIGTIMSYAEHRTPLFSSPDLVCSGMRMGVQNYFDNVSFLRQTVARATVHGWLATTSIPEETKPVGLALIAETCRPLAQKGAA